MNAAANARTSVWERVLPWGMPVLLIAGLILRLCFIGDEGFRNDVSTFEAWALSLVDHGFGKFYSQTGFADYPPGYFYILAVVGHVWHLLFLHSDPDYSKLAALTKVPAILADLGVGALIYAIGCRFARPVYAFGAAALYILNPAVIFISASWGQVDSISGGLALLAVYFLLKSDDAAAEKPAWWVVFAWLTLAYSLLIKPQAAVLIPIFIAFAFVDRSRMRSRVIATGAGIVLGFALAVLLTLPFHPSNPIAALGWLLGRYEYGSSVYAYNSVNAFNLWAIKGQLWEADSQAIVWIPQVVWGAVLVLAALALIVWRYLQDRTPRAMVEASALALLAFFMLATRMHERYVYDGLLFTIACLPIAKRYLWGAVVISVILFLNLLYSLQYLAVLSSPAPAPGVDAHNLWGLGTTVLSFVAVAAFFALGYQFLGVPTEEERAVAPAPVKPSAKPASRRGAPVAAERPWNEAFDWFDPREGLRALSKPLDYIVIAAFGLGNFILSFVHYWYPDKQIFDEVYFARAATEYLQNLRIYENTHPPFTKLLITLSVMLFGGMPHGQGLGGWTGLNAIIGHMANGNNSYGWRFLDVVAGGVSVMILYAFAKRVTGSTLFASIAALLFTFDGMHFVQSRIATPEGFVICFSLFAVYAFYRFWIASQTNERAHVRVPGIAFAAAAGASLLAGGFVATLWRMVVRPPDPASPDTATTVITTLYVALGCYLLARYVVFPRMFGDGKRETTFGDGSFALGDDKSSVLYAADGGILDSKKGPQRGALSQPRGGDLLYEGSELEIAYKRDGSVTYTSPAGSATYANNETRADGQIERGSSSRLWLILFTVALGLLVSSKWYGVMGFGVSFTVLILLWMQRVFFEGRPALWGNPRGFRLDGALVTIVFVAATVYGLVWVPDLLRHGQGDIQNFNDVVYRQYSMFEYHENLRATHPYSSKWFEWPFDYVPVAYFYEDHRTNPSDPHGCCIYEVTTLPNPFNMWLGLLTVPLIGFLAWKYRNKGYALIVVTYLMQWLPWAKSPRIAWEYHFYTDVPLICLCNAIALQWLWKWAKERYGEPGRLWGGIAVGGVVVAIGGIFVFFYPVLVAWPLSWDAWHMRMWMPTWIIGPG